MNKDFVSLQKVKSKAKLQIAQIRGYKNLVFQMEQQEANYPALTPSIAHSRSLKKSEYEERARTISASLVLAYEMAKGDLKKLYKSLIKSHLAREEWWETLLRYAKKAAQKAAEIVRRAVRVAQKLDSADRERLLNVAKLGLGASLVAATWPIIGLAVNVGGSIGSILTALFGWQVTAFAGAVLALIASGNPVVQGAYNWSVQGVKSGVELLPRLNQLWLESA